MEFPVRCFTCGSVLGDLYEKYQLISKQKNAEEALNDLGVDRYCCRRMFMGHVDIVDRITKYPKI